MSLTHLGVREMGQWLEQPRPTLNVWEPLGGVTTWAWKEEDQMLPPPREPGTRAPPC